MGCWQALSMDQRVDRLLGRRVGWCPGVVPVHFGPCRNLNPVYMCGLWLCERVSKASICRCWQHILKLRLWWWCSDVQCDRCIEVSGLYPIHDASESSRINMNQQQPRPRNQPPNHSHQWQHPAYNMSGVRRRISRFPLQKPWKCYSRRRCGFDHVASSLRGISWHRLVHVCKEWTAKDMKTIWILEPTMKVLLESIYRPKNIVDIWSRHSKQQSVAFFGLVNYDHLYVDPYI